MDFRRRRNEGLLWKSLRYITCSLFLIQQDAMGGLPVNKQVTREVCPATALKSLGGLLNCSTGPAKTQHVLSSAGTVVLACWVVR